MSYQSLLSGYADKMNRARSHAEDMNAENREMKANTLEKAFEHITGPLQQGSEGVAALGGAFMAGRKVYKNILKNRAAAAKGEPTSNPSTQGDTRPATGETDDPAPSSLSETGTQGASAGPSESLGSIAEEPDVVGGARTQERVLSEAQESDPAGISAQGQARQQKADTQTDEAEDSAGPQGTGAEEPSAPSGTQLSQAPATEAESDTLAGTGRTAAADLTTAPGAQASPFSGARSLGQTIVKAPAQAAEEAGGDALSQAQGALSSARNAIQGAGQGVKNGVNAAKQALAGAGDDAGATLGEGAGDLAASQSLDWLGPVGLGIGAIGGLVDLFENIFGKPKTAEDLSGPLQTGTAAGIDTEALQSKAPAAVAT